MGGNSLSRVLRGGWETAIDRAVRSGRELRAVMWWWRYPCSCGRWRSVGYQLRSRSSVEAGEVGQDLISSVPISIECIPF